MTFANMQYLFLSGERIVVHGSHVFLFFFFQSVVGCGTLHFYSGFDRG